MAALGGGHSSADVTAQEGRISPWGYPATICHRLMPKWSSTLYAPS
jgi:hypothetical protein